MTQIPNYLTLLRIILIPFYINYFLQQNYLISGSIFTFSIITDFLDGYIARKFNLESPLGKIMDPLADKITVISVLSVFYLLKLIPEYLALILLIREFTILIFSSITFLWGYNLIKPTKVGKIAMFILYLALASKLMGFSSTGKLLIYTAIPLNLISALDYLISGWKFFKKPYNLF
ncbi:MAG: CDP-alcohol phosphatidyltransferase family protein [Halanaerobiales bacterium]